MATDRVTASVTTEAIDLDLVQRAVEGPSSGAIVCFVGAVRDHDHGRAVTHLEYEAHPDAQRVLREVADDIATAHPVHAVAVVHRVGPLGVGEAALVAVVSAAHRGDAFAAAAALVDSVKDRIPIWKHQYFADGTDEWVNCA